LIHDEVIGFSVDLILPAALWPLDNLTAVCEPIIYNKWEPRHLTALWVSTACYRDSFTAFNMPVWEYVRFVIDYLVYPDPYHLILDVQGY
jgi:hypothetical protein